MIRFLLIQLALLSAVWSTELDLSKKHIPTPANFGEAVMGEEVNVELILSNSGNTSIKIDRIKPSCGCTAAEIQSEVIAPGAKTKVKFALDTSQKVGQISKSVRIYLVGRTAPTIILIQGLITKAEKAHAMKAKSIFSPDCALCHSHYGKNRKGRGLYLANCAFCHGVNRNGESAPAINPEDPAMLEKISAGFGSMPGFAEAHGGPLNAVQVDSLVAFLRESSNHFKGTSGSYVYYENCSPCHGVKRYGGSAPSLRYDDLKKFPPLALKQIISDGISGTIMGPFSREKGGSLEEQQIGLLMEYLGVSVP